MARCALCVRAHCALLAVRRGTGTCAQQVPAISATDTLPADQYPNEYLCKVFGKWKCGFSFEFGVEEILMHLVLVDLLFLRRMRYKKIRLLL